MSAFADYAEPLIYDGIAVQLDSDLRALLDKRVNEMPWAGAHVAWHIIPNTVRFNWGHESDSATADFVRSLSIGQSAQLCAFYGTAYPVLLFDAGWLFDNLDVAAINTQQYFLFGFENGVVNTECFAEIETGSTIWGWPN